MRRVALQGLDSIDVEDARREQSERDEILWHTLRMLDHHWRNGSMTREEVLQSLKEAVGSRR